MIPKYTKDTFYMTLKACFICSILNFIQRKIFKYYNREITEEKPLQKIIYLYKLYNNSITIFICIASSTCVSGAL